MIVHLSVNTQGAQGKHTIGIPIWVSNVFYIGYYHITLERYMLRTT